MLKYPALGLTVVHQAVGPVHVAIARHEIIHGFEDALQLSCHVVCLVEESLALAYPSVDMVEPFRGGVILKGNRSVQYISLALHLIIRVIDIEAGKGEVL